MLAIEDSGCRQLLWTTGIRTPFLRRACGGERGFQRSQLHVTSAVILIARHRPYASRTVHHHYWPSISIITLVILQQPAALTYQLLHTSLHRPSTIAISRLFLAIIVLSLLSLAVAQSISFQTTVATFSLLFSTRQYNACTQSPATTINNVTCKATTAHFPTVALMRSHYRCYPPRRHLTHLQRAFLDTNRPAQKKSSGSYLSLISRSLAMSAAYSSSAGVMPFQLLTYSVVQCG